MLINSPFPPAFLASPESRHGCSGEKFLLNLLWQGIHDFLRKPGVLQLKCVLRRHNSCFFKQAKLPHLVNGECADPRRDGEMLGVLWASRPAGAG